MAIIKPFKGILYNKSKVKGFKKVVSPPYDVISPKMQDELYRISPFNFVRMDFGKIKPGDSLSDNRYTRAAGFLKEWLHKEILKKDAKDSIYVYSQTFPHKGRKIERIGFISLFKLPDSGEKGILPHEKTFPKPKLDRLNLTKAIGGNLSPIFSIFDDREKTVLKLLKNALKNHPPAVNVDIDNCVHKIYSINDPKFISRLKKMMLKRSAYIADGHHRYEVALNFRKEMIKNNTHKNEHNFVMMYFAPIEQDGNVILATHRAVKKFPFKKEELFKKLLPVFEIKKFKEEKSLMNALESKTGAKYKIGFYLGNNEYYLAILRDEKILDKLISSENSACWKRLDVAILHELVFKNILGLKEMDEENILYTRDSGVASELVKNKKFKIAFFLKPTEINDVRQIARLGEKMPHKATYFYPKLLSGLVINKF